MPETSTERNVRYARLKKYASIRDELLSSSPEFKNAYENDLPTTGDISMAQLDFSANHPELTDAEREISFSCVKLIHDIRLVRRFHGHTIDAIHLNVSKKRNSKKNGEQYYPHKDIMDIYKRVCFDDMKGIFVGLKLDIGLYWLIRKIYEKEMEVKTGPKRTLERRRMYGYRPSVDIESPKHGTPLHQYLRGEGVHSLERKVKVFDIQITNVPSAIRETQRMYHTYMGVCSKIIDRYLALPDCYKESLDYNEHVANFNNYALKCNRIFAKKDLQMTSGKIEFPMTLAAQALLREAIEFFERPDTDESSDDGEEFSEPWY